MLFFALHIKSELEHLEQSDLVGNIADGWTVGLNDLRGLFQPWWILWILNERKSVSIFFTLIWNTTPCIKWTGNFSSGFKFDFCTKQRCFQMKTKYVHVLNFSPWPRGGNMPSVCVFRAIFVKRELIKQFSTLIAASLCQQVIRLKPFSLSYPVFPGDHMGKFFTLGSWIRFLPVPPFLCALPTSWTSCWLNM